MKLSFAQRKGLVRIITGAVFCACCDSIIANPSEATDVPYNHDGTCFYVIETAKNKEKKARNLKSDNAKRLFDASHVQILYQLLITNYKDNVANGNDDVSFMDGILQQITSHEELNILFSMLCSYESSGDDEIAECDKIKIIMQFFNQRYSINKDTIYDGIYDAFSNKEYALVDCLLSNCENLIDVYMSVFESQVLKGSFDVNMLSYILDNVSSQNDINLILFEVCSYRPPKFNTTCGKCLENYKIDLLKILISYHAELASEYTDSIAFEAAFNAEYKLMFYLLDNGANVNYITKGGETILSHIIMHEREKQCEIICEHLLSFPVNLNIGTPLPMRAALYLKYTKVVDMLKKHEQHVFSK